MSKTLLITGATGKQGRACIEALLASPQASSFTILAVTRNATSLTATSLSKRAPNIKVVQGNLDDCPAMFSAATKAVKTSKIWGVFGVTTPAGGSEERQGKNLVDAAVASGVEQFVFTSADRGGEKSQTTPTNVPHFISKFNIEHHLQTQAAQAGGNMAWTIFRPVAFMDNLTPDFVGKMFTTAWKITVSNSKPLQLISSHDCGVFAAQAFLRPEEHRNKGLSIASDELTYEEANLIFKKKMGNYMPTTFGTLASFGLWAIKDLGLMFKWFQAEGFGADVAACRKMQPGLLGFGDWIETKSAFTRK